MRWYVRKAGLDNRDQWGPAKMLLKLNKAKFRLVEHVVPNNWSRPLASDGKCFFLQPNPTCCGAPGFHRRRFSDRSPLRVSLRRAGPGPAPAAAAEEAPCTRGSAPAARPDVFGALCKFPVMPSILRKIGR